MTIAFLASGNLGLTVIKACAEKISPQFIATDSGSATIIEYAAEKNIPVFKGNPRQGKLAAFMQQYNIDLLLSVNYLFIVEKDVIEQVKYPVNFHGSLLPKYRGRTPHVWAIINNETKTGVTAHIIDDGCDTGDIVLQKEIHIDKNDTGAGVLKKYEAVYPAMVMEVIAAVENNAIRRTPQDNSKATYFSKRTPEDGGINWQWQKERIQNWVRAQAYPYPGAFCFAGNNKVVIDAVGFSDYGFNDTDANGTILSMLPFVIVKTSNGAIALTSIREGREHLTKGKILQ